MDDRQVDRYGKVYRVFGEFSNLVSIEYLLDLGLDEKKMFFV